MFRLTVLYCAPFLGQSIRKGLIQRRLQRYLMNSSYSEVYRQLPTELNNEGAAVLLSGDYERAISIFTEALSISMLLRQCLPQEQGLERNFEVHVARASKTFIKENDHETP